MDLTEDIRKILYIKPKLVDIYITGYGEPIQYILDKNNHFNPQMSTYKNGNFNPSFWSKPGLLDKIYESKAVHAVLDKLDSEDLWTKKDKENHVYTYVKGEQPRVQTRKRAVYNKNNKLLPVGWHRVSKNGKNWFEGPRAARYNRMNLHTNKNSRVKNRTYRVVEGRETWYILPDGSLSWYPFKVPAT